MSKLQVTAHVYVSGAGEPDTHLTLDTTRAEHITVVMDRRVPGERKVHVEAELDERGVRKLRTQLTQWLRHHHTEASDDDTVTYAPGPRLEELIAHHKEKAE